MRRDEPASDAGSGGGLYGGMTGEGSTAAVTRAASGMSSIKGAAPSGSGAAQYARQRELCQQRDAAGQAGVRVSADQAAGCCARLGPSGSALAPLGTLRIAA